MRTEFDKRTSASRELVIVQAQPSDKLRMAAWLAIPLMIIAASIVFTPDLDTLLK